MADNKGGFLGGAPQFNEAGVGAPDDGSPEAISSTPQSLQPYQVRNIVIVLVIVVMLGVLFVMDFHGIAGVGRKGGSGHGLNAAPEATDQGYSQQPTGQ